VHFGSGSSIPRSDRAGIERAGNDAFKKGDFAGGASAIFIAAAGAVSGTIEEQPAPAAPQQGSSFPLLPIILLGAAGLAIGSFFFRRRTPPEGTYVSGYGPPGGGYGPDYYGPGYGGPRPGMGPVGGGLIGGALGGIAGYELGKAAGEREERAREDRDYGGGDYGGGSSDSNYDAGGGGSSWDSGGSDGGGGFDSGGGGGGFDGGGGGGSDF
jgi:hypothetical protein